MNKHHVAQAEFDDASTLDGDEKAAFLDSYAPRDDKNRRRMIWLTFINIFFFVISSLTLICTIFAQRSPSAYSTPRLMEQFGLYSPAMNVVEYSKVKFELPNPLNSSKYVGITDDVENAWMDIAYLPDQMVSMEKFPKLQKPADSLMATDPRSGETGYRVGLEVFHQLHCLNLLRMSTYPEYYPKLWWSDTNDKPEKVRAHLDHCIEILRMNLMCLSDINVFTFHTIEGREEEGPWPDYESLHVCRNFDAIKQWANDNAMPDEDV